MVDGNQDHVIHDLQDYYYKQIFGRKDIPRRINWIQKAIALSQSEVTSALMMHASYNLNE
jgi:hypothetical protein